MLILLLQWLCPTTMKQFLRTAFVPQNGRNGERPSLLFLLAPVTQTCRILDSAAAKEQQAIVVLINLLCLVSLHRFSRMNLCTDRMAGFEKCKLAAINFGSFAAPVRLSGQTLSPAEVCCAVWSLRSKLERVWKEVLNPKCLSCATFPWFSH